MADMCLPQLHCDRMRIANLDSNGVPTPGADNLYVSAALTVLTFSPVYEDGTETTIKNAADEICLDYRGPDNLRRGDVNLTICTHDPYLMAMLGGGSTIEDGDAVGMRGPAIGPVTGNGISIELWTKRINDGVVDDDFPYARWALPRIKNLREGEHSFTNAEKLPAFSGQMYENPNWFDGPLNDWPATSDRMYQWIPVGVGDLPAASCGPQTLAAS